MATIYNELMTDDTARKNYLKSSYCQVPLLIKIQVWVMIYVKIIKPFICLRLSFMQEIVHDSCEGINDTQSWCEAEAVLN